MRQDEIDTLYHLLRRASNDSVRKGQSLATGLTSSEEGEVILGLARHLLAGGDYTALVKFSAFYGAQFLLPKVAIALLDVGWRFSRVVELGAGLGWLGRGLSAKFGCLPTLFVDKRPWSLIDIVADIETPEGRKEVLQQLKPEDLIVASDLLHCLDLPEEVMDAFSGWRAAILEYFPCSEEFGKSYKVQITRYGAKPISHPDLYKVFRERVASHINIDPYMLVLAEEKR